MTMNEIRFRAAVPQFAVSDVVRTAEYYRDVLGFEIAGYWDGERVTEAPSTAATPRTSTSPASTRWPRSSARAAPRSSTSRRTASTGSGSS